MKCVVTGGAGFIGSNLSERLLSKGHEVIALDDLSTGRKQNLQGLDVDFAKGTILDLPFLQKTFEGCDWVFHQAAIPSVIRSVEDPAPTIEVNIKGTLNVLLAARDANVKKVVFASSSSVYGDTVELPKKESMTPAPKTPYALSKFAGEQFCKQFFELYGLPTACIRYFNVFGPRQNPNSEYAAVIPKFINAVRSDESPTIFSDGNQTRDFTFIEDVCDANILAAESDVKEGTSMNVAYNKNITVNKLLEMINEILGKDVKAKHVDPRPGDIRDSLADISLAQGKIGYKPQFDMESGLKKTVEWFSANEK